MSKLFGGNRTPKEEPEPVAPIPDEELERINQERAYQRRYHKMISQSSKGRSGTILSGQSGTLGLA